jgi:hypothetical protein
MVDVINTYLGALSWVVLTLAFEVHSSAMYTNFSEGFWLQIHHMVVVRE